MLNGISTEFCYLVNLRSSNSSAPFLFQYVITYNTMYVRRFTTETETIAFTKVI